MGYFYKLIEYLQQWIFYFGNLVFENYLSLFFIHFYYQESIFEFIINRILSLFLDNISKASDIFWSKIFKEIFIFIDSIINKFSYNIWKKSCISFTKLFDIKLISWKWLDLFLINFRNFFTKLLTEDTFCLRYVIYLLWSKIRNSNSLFTFFR